MRDMLNRLLTPANAACIAALLIAIGVEVTEVHVRDILEIIGAVIAIIGFLWSFFA